MALQQITDVTFETTVLKADELVLVDFWAPWCGPCQMLGPILEEVAPQLPESVKIVKLDIDQNPQSAAKFGVRSIPTMILFKNGEAVSTKVGLLTKAKIVEWVQQNQ